MFFNYVIESETNSEIYTGYTNNLERRIKEHNQRLNFSTKGGVPWKYIYYEACLNQKDAIRREHYMKTTQGQRLLKRRLKEYLYAKRKI